MNRLDERRVGAYGRSSAGKIASAGSSGDALLQVVTSDPSKVLCVNARRVP
jgi:hypothetical protein